MNKCTLCLSIHHLKDIFVVFSFGGKGKATLIISIHVLGKNKFSFLYMEI